MVLPEGLYFHQPMICNSARSASYILSVIAFSAFNARTAWKLKIEHSA